MKKFIFFLTMQLIFISNVYTMEESSDIHKNKLTPFWISAFNKNKEIIKLHFKQRSPLVNQYYFNKLIHRDEGLATQLMKESSDIHKDRLTPFEVAVLKGHKRIIELLLKGGPIDEIDKELNKRK